VKRGVIKEGTLETSNDKALRPSKNPAKELSSVLQGQCKIFIVLPSLAVVLDAERCLDVIQDASE
jgi:hypothetical protein